ncbi:MAG: methionine--tRNA ligase subunit beta [Deltaproteobacteria bacterium]|nr:methionine--tRNA ligase subunit beta [Deltaproteobacteria bacterium]
MESSKAGQEKSTGPSEKKKGTAPPFKKAPAAQKSQISFEDFQKMDLRIGTIKAAEAIADSKKLIRLTVDTGEERPVVAGLKGHYEAADLIGMQVVVVVNLKPVTLMGIASRGMLLAASDASGLHLLTPDSKTEPGSKVS